MTPVRIRTVGFVGTGIMGAPIAGHIMDAGYDLTVYNRTVSKTDALVARGAHLASSPADAVRDGATHLVVGRPILGAPDPAAAARAIRAEMGT